MIRELPPALDPGPRGAVLRLDGEPFWRRYVDPKEILEAREPHEVVPVLEELERKTEEGEIAVGFLAYEAAPSLCGVLATREPADLPLASFALFRGAGKVMPPQGIVGGFETGDWESSVQQDEYLDAVRAIHQAIARGETYQVNYTYRLGTSFHGSPWAFFRSLAAGQRQALAAYLDLGRHAICSLSPELFFRRKGERIVARPMKGTAAREPRPDEDEAVASRLEASPKERAENVMIVDMMRNDLGRIATAGTVRVPELFRVERHETIWQMTSTVEAETTSSLLDVLRAVFPCASVTGAPKVRTMEIIRELETGPRGAYTGAIGVVGPGRRAHFSVGIRTAVVDREKKWVEYGTGSGVVWDSEPEAEYRECHTKSLLLSVRQRPFHLLESLLWRPGSGFVLLDRHLERLEKSARYFDYRLPEDLQVRLERLAGELEPGGHKIRLTLSRRGELSLSAEPLPQRLKRPCRVALSETRISSSETLLYHKTTQREVYRQARREWPEMDDVILCNERGELTESTVANLVLRRGGELLTPPLSSGLLPGTLRAELLCRGRIREEVLTAGDLHRADGAFLINSVRGWIPAVLMTAE